MGLFLRQNENRSQLQSKVAADLSERLQKHGETAKSPKPQPAILDNQRQMSTAGLAWTLLAVAVVVSLLLGLLLLRP